MKLYALIAVCLLCSTEALLAFPIDQFKQFLNTKPTIESCDFKVWSTKFPVHGLREDTYRPFNLVFENDTKYRLIEDRRDYLVQALIPDVMPGHERKLVEIHPPIKQFCWSRFGDKLSSTFNPDGVIETSLTSSTVKATRGPARSSKSIMGIAYDALNLGVTDLGIRGVTWTGSRFACLANEFGGRIDGELLIDADNRPKGLSFEITHAGQRFRYEVGYEFGRSSDMPEFFPSRIKIEFVSQVGRRLTSDYQILRLRLSDRRLSAEDVAFVSNQTTNLNRYVYTNDNVFRVVTNSVGLGQLKRIPSSTEVIAMHRPQFGNKKLFVFLFLVLSSIVPLLLYSKVKAKQQKKETTNEKQV